MIETPVVFRAGDNDLFGIVSSPEANPRGTGVTILAGGRYAASCGRNRVAVRLAEQLCADGYTALRFDYHGVGDSSGTIDGFRSNRPFVEDVQGAVECLREFGVTRHIAIGDCFGARTALESIDRVPELEALLLVSLPLRDFARGEDSALRMAERVSIAGYGRKLLSGDVWRSLRNRKLRRAYRSIIGVKVKHVARSVASGGSEDAWLSRSAVARLEEASDRGMPVLMLYGTDEHYYEDFERAVGGRLGPVLEAAPRTEVKTVPGHMHAFRSLEAQELFLDIAREWLQRNDVPAAGGR